MASAPGFSIASSPPGAIGGVSTSPVKFGKSSAQPTRKGPTATQLLEQIRQLEHEGNKLRTETSGGGPSSFAALTDLNISALSSDRAELPKFTSTSPSSLSALVDISAEQKTISDLRLQLEQQRMETDRLNSHLVGDGFTSSTSRAGTVLHIPSSPSKTGFSTLPSTELFSARRAFTGTTSELAPPSHLEKALKDSQEQVADLRKRLMDATSQSESQKREFRQTVEELKAKLHDTTINRESILDLKQKEVVTYESQVGQLQMTIKDLQTKLKAQEQALSDASRKADGYSRENYVSETTLSQVRLVLVDAERRRGRPYFDTDPASSQNAAMLVHTLERCIQEMIKDTEVSKAKVDEMEKEIAEVRQSQTSGQQNLSLEYQQNDDETVVLCKRITQMTVEHEQQMQQANERASNSRKQAASLQSQLSVIQGQHDQQLKLKEDTVKEMENKIKHLREELAEERDKYTAKRESLEHTVSDTEREMCKLRGERDEATRNHSSMEARVADLQLTIKRLNRDMESEKESSGKFWEREGQLRSRQVEMETRLEEKTRDVDRLEKMLATVKQECNATVSEKISMIERQERERHMDKISSLTAQLSEVSEKCNKLSLDHDNMRVENRDLRQQARELTDRTDATKVQYEAAVAERKHLTDMLTAKTSDFDRVSQERDYYFNIMEQKNNELSQLRTLKERLTVQLEEKEKNITILQEQLTSLQQMIETNSRSSESMREERDAYAKQLQETTAALEEVRSLRDTMSKKMKIRERRIRELEAEKEKTGSEIELRNQELGIIQQEKETLFKELKESRYELANLSEEKDATKKELESHKYHSEKTIGKLQYRLKSIEQDMGLAQKALRKRESVDNTAVKMADKMQKEVTAKRSLVDTLQSKIRWYQDQIDTLIKEKTAMDGDKEKLKSSLNKSLVQNQQLTVDLETANSRCVELKTHSSQLESSLEKLIREQKKDATVRNATTHAQVEMFEQEMTRMKLAHQLDMKEAIQKAVTRQHQQTGTSAATKCTAGPQAGGTSSGVSHVRPEHSHMRPEHMAQQDRLTAQKSGESYRELGSELKHLLTEMRTLITDKQTDRGDKPVTSSTRERRDRGDKRGRPGYRPVFTSPTGNREKAFTHYRVPQTPSDISYHSDTEVDDRLGYNRSRTANYALYSPERPDERRLGGRERHRRSRSAEASFVLPRDSTHLTDSDCRMSDFSIPGLQSDISGRSTAIEETYSTAQMSAVESELLTSLSVSSSVMESSEENVPVPDTQEMCKRLEERILSLTRMGGNLQKENKEMADLMKTQGKKLKKVRETEKRIRKTKR